MNNIVFTSTVDLPDGRRITASIEVPELHPAGFAWEQVGDNSEIAHMAAMTLVKHTLRGDAAREKDAIEKIAGAF